MIRVLVTDGMDKKAIEQLKQQGFQVSEQRYGCEDLGAAMAQYDALVVRSATQVRSCHIDQAKNSNLKLIVRGGVGVDNIDVDYAEQNGIAVRNTPRASSRSVAELAMAHIFSCSRFISSAGHSMKEDKWEKKAFSHGMEIFGKTLGIIGFGRIGQELGRMAKALGMEVLAFDVFPVPCLETEIGMRYVSLEELLRKSDLISLHCPLFPSTYHMINKETIALMKDTAILVNTSRGGLIDTEALIEALKAKKFSAVGLDVYEHEDELVYENHFADIITNETVARLLMFPQVVITSHQAFFTREALQAIAVTTMENVYAFEHGLPLVNEVKQ
jgi:D-3-phosphoglycerate dehydrogenase